jgi:hypothetical protein
VGSADVLGDQRCGTVGIARTNGLEDAEMLVSCVVARTGRAGLEPAGALEAA